MDDKCMGYKCGLLGTSICLALMLLFMTFNKCAANTRDREKEAIHRGHATYDDEGNFTWNDEEKE